MVNNKKRQQHEVVKTLAVTNKGKGKVTKKGVSQCSMKNDKIRRYPSRTSTKTLKGKTKKFAKWETKNNVSGSNVDNTNETEIQSNLGSNEKQIDFKNQPILKQNEDNTNILSESIQTKDQGTKEVAGLRKKVKQLNELVGEKESYIESLNLINFLALKSNHFETIRIFSLKMSSFCS